jgi:predicted N-acetyltransferase YhbS
MHDASAIAVEWAALEGWNPGLDDAQRFARADPGAFLCTEHDGDVVATVSCALYGDDYAFIGFYIVREDLRGQGFGRPLFDRALARAGDRVVGLDGVLEQEATYARSGFELAHRNARYEGSGGGVRPDEVVELAQVPHQELLAYDAAIFGAERRAFLETWMAARPSGMTLAVRDGDGLRGYAIGRPCREGVRAGPLFADDPDTADALFRGLAAAAGDGTPLFLDVPETNADAVALAQRYGMQSVFATSGSRSRSAVAMCSAVASPVVVGFVASTTSVTPPAATRA